MSKLDIAEKRLPQDGRISLKIAGRAVDVRVSTMPSGHGERVVLRLLDKQAGRLDLNSLGMDEKSQAMMDDLRVNDIDRWRRTFIESLIEARAVSLEDERKRALSA